PGGTSGLKRAVIPGIERSTRSIRSASLFVFFTVKTWTTRTPCFTVPKSYVSSARRACGASSASAAHRGNKRRARESRWWRPLIEGVRETPEGRRQRPLRHVYRRALLDEVEPELDQALALVRVLPEKLLEPRVEEADRLADGAPVDVEAAVERPERLRHV